MATAHWIPQGGLCARQLTRYQRTPLNNKKMWLLGAELIPQKHFSDKIENVFSAQTIQIHPFYG